MNAITETESMACRDRCQFIDSLWRGDGRIVSYDIEVPGRFTYVGFALRVFSLIKRGETTRHNLALETGVEMQVIAKLLIRMKRDGTIIESPGSNGRRLLRAVS